MDNNGLICAWLLDGKGAGRELGWDDLRQAQPRRGEVLWLHFDYSVPAVQSWLESESGLSHLTIAALSQSDPRPRVVPADGGLMLFLRAVNLNPGAEPDDMVSARIWLDERRVISLRQRRLVSMDDLRVALRAGRGPVTSGGFLAMLTNSILDRIEPVIELLDEHIDALEEPNPAASISEQRHQLGEIRRQAIALRRFLAPQREALNRLVLDNSALFSEFDRLLLREESDRQTRIVEELDSARERAAVAQESLVNRMSEQANQRMFVLSVVAAIFLPLSFLTGLLGINVGGIPGTDNPYAFLLVVIVLGVCGAGLWYYFRKRKWF